MSLRLYVEFGPTKTWGSQFRNGRTVGAEAVYSLNPVLFHKWYGGSIDYLGLFEAQNISTSKIIYMYPKLTFSVISLCPLFNEIKCKQNRGNE